MSEFSSRRRRKFSYKTFTPSFKSGIMHRVEDMQNSAKKYSQMSILLYDDRQHKNTMPPLKEGVLNFTAPDFALSVYGKFRPLYIIMFMQEKLFLIVERQTQGGRVITH